MNYIPLIILPFGLAYSYYAGFTPPLISLIFFIASLLTYYIYAKDKSAAKRSEWRVPENTLHMHSLLFGWPGAIVAQQRLRHKTKKVSFRIVFWITVIANVSGIGWVHTANGNQFLFKNTVKLEGFLLNTITDSNMTKFIKFVTEFHRKMPVK